MKNKFRRTLLVLIALVAVLATQLANMPIAPFYAKEYETATEAVDAAKNMHLDDNIMTLNSDLKTVFVKDTSIALVKDGKNFASQGHFYIDGNTGKVIYCLDPTILVGDKVDYQKLASEGEHTFYSFDQETQAKIVAVGYAANELYAKTENQNYLLLGQYLTWNLSGSDILYMDNAVGTLMPELNKLADQKLSQISKNMKKYVTLLDTSGQDLIELSNAPIIDLSKPEDKVVPEEKVESEVVEKSEEKVEEIKENEAPTIYASNYTYDAGAIQTGETLLDVNELTAKLFAATAIDAEDGNITKNIKVDYSAVDVTKPGVYNIVLSVVDENGKEASITVKLILTNDSTSIDENYLLHGKDITTDDKSILELGAPYQKAASVYAQDFDGKQVAVNSKELDRQTFTSKDEGMTDLTIVKVENSTDTTDSLSQENYIYYVEDLKALDGTPLLYADSLILNIGDEYTTDLFNASAFDVDRHLNITGSIKFSGKVDTSKVGVYPVEISVKDADGETTTITRYVTVKGDNSVIDPDQTILLDAGDFYTNEQALATLEDVNAFIIEESNAQAFSLVDGSTLTTSVQTTTLTKESQAGVYTAVITTTDGKNVVTKPINIYVANDGDTIDKTKPYLTAQGFKVNVGDTVSKTQYKAVAFDRQDGNLVDKIVYPTVDTTSVGPKKVILSVTDSDGNKTSINVVVSVVDEDTVIDENDKAAIYGINVQTDILTLAEFTTQEEVDDYILTQAKAFAFDMVTGDNLDVTLTNTDVTATTVKGEYTVKISATTADGVTVEKEITVTVKDAEMIIEAKDIVTNEDTLRAMADLNDVKQFTLDQSEAYAMAKVKRLTVDYTVNLNDLTTDSTIGTYPVEISATNGVVSASTTINVYVLNDGDEHPEANEKPYIYGESIMVNAGDPIDNSEYKGYAYDRQDGELTDGIVYPSVDTNVEGAHQVQLTVTDKDGKQSQKDVTVYVKGENTDVSENSEVMLTAFDIYTNESTLSKQTNLENKVIEASRAQAFDMLTDQALDITVDLKGLTANSTAGIYTVELTATNGTDTATRTINVYVARNDETVDPEKPYISADNLTVNVGDAYNTGLFNAIAFDRQDGDLTDSIVYPNVTDILDAEGKFKEFGVYKYDVRVEDEAGNTSTKPVTITVLDEDSVLNTDEDIVLRATDIYTNENTISSQTNILDFILTESVAKAFLTESGDDISSEIFVQATNLAITSTKGVYTATITVKYDIDGVEKTLSKDINIYVAEGTEVADAEDPYLAADSLIVQVNDEITAEDFNAVAFDLKDGDLTATINYNLPITTDEVGVFTHTVSVTDSDGNVTEDIVTITVMNEDSVISPDNKVMLHATNIRTNEFTLENYGATIEAFILENADAFAFNTENGASINPVVDTTDLTLASTYGTYTATISATIGTSSVTKTINIFVAKDGEVIPENGNPYLTGENVRLKIGDEISNAAFAAYAADKEDGDLTTSISYPSYSSFADTSNITNKVGVFKVDLNVTDANGNKTTKQLLVVVTSDDTVIDAEDKYMIDAKDIYTNEDTVKAAGDLNQFILTESQAKAFNLNTGATLTVAVKSTDLKTTVGVYTATIKLESPAGVLRKEINIFVAKGSEQIDPEKPYIYAENVTVQLGDETVDPELYNAVAFDRQDGDLTADIVIPDFAITKRGVYTNTLTVTDSEGLESVKEVKITVLDGSEVIIPDKDIIIFADDIFTNVDSVKAATDLNQFIIDNAEAEAYKISTGEDISSQINVDSENLSTLVGPGIADAVFQVGTDGDAQAPIKIYVANGSDEVDAHDPYITSGNLTLELGQEFKLSDLKPVAFDRQDGDLTSKITNSSFADFVDEGNLADTVGVHLVTFTVVDTALTTKSNNSFVTVTDPDTSVVGDNIMIDSLNTLKTTTLAMANIADDEAIKESILMQSHAIAYDMLDGSILPVTVTNLNGLVKGAGAGDYEVTITAVKDGRTVSKTITVTVEALEVVLTAENIYTNEDTIAGITSTVNEWILAQSNAEALNGDGTTTSISMDVKVTNLKADSLAGRYTATIEATNGVSTTSREIKIIVAPNDDIIPDQAPYLTAENFKVEQNSTVTTGQFKAHAEDRQDGNITPDIDFKLPVDTSKVGVVKHTISVTDSEGNTTSKEVLISVTNSETVISPDEKIMLYAKDIYTNVDTLKANNTDLEAYLKTAAQAVAYNMTDGANLTDTITITTNTVEEKPGIYEVTFNVAAAGSPAISKTIHVFVADGSIDPYEKPYVHGENIVKNVGDVFDIADLNANAFAFDDEVGILTNEIQYDTSKVSVDNSSGTPVYDKVGVYKVKMTVEYDGITSTHNSYITVVDEQTIVDPDGQLIIRAVDFTDSEVGVNANRDDLNGYVKTNGEAVAYNMTTGAVVKVNVTANPVTDVAGEYVVTFSATAGGSTITKDITVTVTSSRVVVEAVDIYTNEDTLRGLTPEEIAAWIVEQSNATVQNNLAVIDAADVVTNLLNTSKYGDYAATIKASNPVHEGEKTIQIHVAKGGEEIQQDGPYITSEKTTGIVGERFDQGNMNLYAYDRQDGNLTTAITADAGNKYANNAVMTDFGVFPMTYNVTDGNGNTAATTSTLTVTREGTVIDDKAMIDANDVFTSEATLAGKITADTVADFIISDSKAAGYKLADGEVGTVTVNTAGIRAEAGIYNVTYVATFGDGSTISIDKKVFVTKDAEVTPDDKPYLTADDLTVNVGDAVTNEMFNVVAFDRQDGEDVTVTIGTYTTAEVGVFAVPITATDSDGNVSNYTSTLVVKADNSEIENDLMLTFDDISTNTDALALETNLDAFIIRESNADAWDILEATNVTDKITVSKAYAYEADGVYDGTSTPFTLTSGAGIYRAELKVTSVDGTRTMTREVFIYVGNDGDTISDDDPYVTISNVVKNVGETVTNADYNIVYFDKQDKLDLTVDYPAAIDTSYAHVERVSVTVTDSDGKTATANATVVIKGEDSVYENNILLTGSDFEIADAALVEVTDIDQMIKDNGNVTAYDAQSGAQLPVTLTHTITPTTTPGEYTVTLKATSGANTVQKDIQVTIIDLELDIAAESIYTNETAVAGLTTDALKNDFIINESGARGLYKAIRRVQVQSTNMALTKGEYTATLYVTDGINEATKDIKIIVLPGDEVVDANGLWMNANNVTVNVGDTVTNAMFGAYGYDKQEDGKLTTFTYPDNYDTSKMGIVNVTISSAGLDGSGTRTVSKDVKLIVLNDGAVTDGDVAIYGDFIKTNTNEVKTLTAGTINDWLLAEAGASAIDLAAAENLTPTVKSTTLTPTSPAGVYSVTFTATNGTDTAEITVPIYVANGNDNIVDGETYIYGENARTEQVVDGTVDLTIFNAVAMNTETGNLTSSITPTTFSVSETGVFKHTLTVDGASTDVTLTVTSEDSIIKDNLFLEANNIYTNEVDVAKITDMNAYIKAESNAKAFNMDTAETLTINIVNKDNVSSASKRGVYQVEITATSGGKTVSKIIDFVILPNDAVMPDNGSYIYAENVEVERDGNYEGTMHNVFAYDKGVGQIIYNDVDNTGVDEVDPSIGNVYPVNFSFVNRDGETIAIDVTAEVKMPPIELEMKVNAMNLDLKAKTDSSAYKTENRFTYKLRVREGAEENSGPVIYEANYDAKANPSTIYERSGSTIKWEPNKTYNIGFYEIGTGRDYYISSIIYETPNIDPGANGQIYSCGNGDLTDTCSGDNVSYIDDIYEFESIGYEENPQAGRVEFLATSADQSKVDLTVAKYGRTYRPFGGNYRLSGDIDASATKTDTRPDALGGFGSDGFKPIGYKFTTATAYGAGGAGKGQGFFSEFADSFTGKLDGNLFKISNLYMNRYTEQLDVDTATTGNIGIFGKVGKSNTTAQLETMDPNISDLTIKDAEISADKFANVGTLVGINSGRIAYVTVESNISGFRHVGGIVGKNGISQLVNGIIENSHFNGNVYSTFITIVDQNLSGAGGIVGRQEQDSITRFNTSSGYIDGDDNIGGIVGRNWASLVTRNYSDMTVEGGSNSIGGIVGYSSTTLDETSHNIYAGNVIYSNDGGAFGYFGGAVGWNDGLKSTHNIVSGSVYGQGASTAGAIGSNRTTEYNVSLGTKVVVIYGAGGIVNVVGYTANSWYTPNSKVLYPNGNAGTNYDAMSKSTQPSEMQSVTWWTSKGYKANEYDFSGLSSGLAPKLVNADGDVLPHQKDIRLDANPAPVTTA